MRVLSQTSEILQCLVDDVCTMEYHNTLDAELAGRVDTYIHKLYACENVGATKGSTTCTSDKVVGDFSLTRQATRLADALSAAVTPQTQKEVTRLMLRCPPPRATFNADSLGLRWQSCQGNIAVDRFMRPEVSGLGAELAVHWTLPMSREAHQALVRVPPHGYHAALWLWHSGSYLRCLWQDYNSPDDPESLVLTLADRGIVRQPASEVIVNASFGHRRLDWRITGLTRTNEPLYIIIENAGSQRAAPDIQKQP